MIALELRDVVINQYYRSFREQYWFWTDRMGGRLLCVRVVVKPVLSDDLWEVSLSLNESDDSLSTMIPMRATTPVFRFNDLAEKSQYEEQCRGRLKRVLASLDFS